MLSDWLLPSFCLACRRAGRTSALGLCPPCQSRLRPQPRHACRWCGQGLPGLTPSSVAWPACGTCSRNPPPYDFLLVGWIYAPPLDAVLRALKFHRLEYLAHPLARQVYDRCHPDLAGIEALLAVPLPWWRRASRGFNQAELLARPIAERLACPLLSMRQRGLRPPQHALGRLRRLLDARRDFTLSVQVAQQVRGRTLLLVDDIVTTGATLRLAARALQRAGAGRIVALAFGRTPDRREAV